MATVLVTGFEPFGGDDVNPSIEAARSVHGWRPTRSTQVVAEQIPCRFGAAIEGLQAAIATHKPSLVLALGLAGSRSDISVERVAINVDDARIPDNAGRQPVDIPVVPDGPAAYFSSLPIKAIVQALHHHGIPASVSQTAGTFVCNHLFYGLAHLIATRYPKLRGGFIHVPALPQQVVALPGSPSMAQATINEAVRVAIATALKHKRDIRLGAGAID